MLDARGQGEGGQVGYSGGGRDSFGQSGPTDGGGRGGSGGGFGGGRDSGGNRGGGGGASRELDDEIPF